MEVKHNFTVLGVTEMRLYEVRVAMISTKFIRFSFDKLARTHKIPRSFSPRVLVPKPVPTGSAYVTHAPREPHFGSDICKNGFFNTFFPLSHTFYFETRPSPLSKIGENAFDAHPLQLYRKNEYGDPHFLFHDFNKDSASFR